MTSLEEFRRGLAFAAVPVRSLTAPPASLLFAPPGRQHQVTGCQCQVLLKSWPAYPRRTTAAARSAGRGTDPHATDAAQLSSWAPRKARARRMARKTVPPVKRKTANRPRVSSQMGGNLQRMNITRQAASLAISLPLCLNLLKKSNEQLGPVSPLCLYTLTQALARERSAAGKPVTAARPSRRQGDRRVPSTPLPPPGTGRTRTMTSISSHPSRSTVARG